LGSVPPPGERSADAPPEIAIAGRSNAGKSSLLNVIGGRRDLARVSKTPGRTQRLHFFRERQRGFVLVDLPGFGFARVSKETKRQLSRHVEAYLRARPTLRGLVLLLDVRRDPQTEERMLADFAASRGVRLLCVATKVDKLGRAERLRRLRALDEAGFGSWLAFSAVSSEGRDAVIEAMERLAGPRALAGSAEPSS
jgi:GTP-binding protein